MSPNRFNKETPSFYAKKLLLTLNIDTIPIDVQGIARSLGIIVKEVEADSFEGCAIKVKGKAGILLGKRNIYEPRKRFTVAHELGHISIPYHEGEKYVCKADDMVRFKAYGIADEEAEANEFAAELLMPEDMLREDCEDLNINKNSIEILSQKYNVSKTAAMLRFLVFTYGICAAIFVKDGYIKSFKPSDNFSKDKLFIAIKEKVSPISSVGKYFYQKIPLPDAPVEAPANCWLSERFKKQPYRINEYTFEIEPYKSVIVFIWTGDDYQRYLDESAY